MRMARPEVTVSSGPTEGERLVPPQTNGADKTSLGVLGTPEPLHCLQRTQGVWQVPELDVVHAKALVELWPPGSFLVPGHDTSQILVLKTGPSLGDVNTYQIQKFPGGVCLESSNLCLPDLPHLLAFLSASRDILPRTLLLPSPSLRPADERRDPAQVGGVHCDPSRRVLSAVNRLYLETQGGREPAPGAAPRKHAPPRGSPSPAEPGPRREAAARDDDRGEEDGPEDELTAHVRALAAARSSYVARQCRGLRARLTSNSGGPHRPGDPATELLQDVRHLLTDLQEYLEKDPDVRAVFGSRGPGMPSRAEDLGPAVEAAVCRAVLAPLKPALWRRLRTLRAQELRRLRRRQVALRAGAGPRGAQGAGPAGQSSAPGLRSRIHTRLAHLHAACAPRRKVALLLAVCGDVYASLAGRPDPEPQGADAFLPALTEELIWSPHIGETQLDVEFLMELLDPEELRGEAGYYLTTWFGALHHIAHYQPDAARAPRGLSSEARASLRQWHRRRTLSPQHAAQATAPPGSQPPPGPDAPPPQPRPSPQADLPC